MLARPEETGSVLSRVCLSKYRLTGVAAFVLLISFIAFQAQAAPSATPQGSPQSTAAGSESSTPTSTLIGPTSQAIEQIPQQASPPQSLIRSSGPLTPGDQWRLDKMVSVTVDILILSVMFLIAEFALLWRVSASPEFIMRTVIVTLVVTLGVCSLIVGGGDQQQYGPIIGLFGSIIGFLLGQGSTTRQVHQFTGRAGETPANSLNEGSSST